MNGFLVPGLQPAGRAAEQEEAVAALAKLKYLVVMDPLRDRDRGVLEELRRRSTTSTRRRSRPRCSACRPAASPRRPGSFTNSSRVVQWKERRPTRRAKPRSTREIIARLFVKLREMYAKDGGKLPEPIAEADLGRT